MAKTSLHTHSAVALLPLGLLLCSSTLWRRL